MAKHWQMIGKAALPSRFIVWMKGIIPYEVKMDIEQLRKKFPGGVIRNQHPYYMAEAINDIPGCLRACTKAEMLQKIQQAVSGFKPSHIHLVGCGTSYNACQAAGYILQNYLHLPCSVHDAFDFEVDTPPDVDANSLVIGISESGQSITTCLSIEIANKAGAFTVGISANPESRLAKTARLALIDPYLHEIPLGKTRTYLSSTLLAILACLLTSDEETHSPMLANIQSMITALQNNKESLESAARQIAESLPAHKNRYIVTGFGAQKPNADELRLKIMEVLGESATSFGLEEFTHGPSACFDEDLIVLLLQTDPRTLEKAVRIASGVAFSRARLIVITDQPDAGWTERAQVISVPQVEESRYLGLFPAVVAAQHFLYYAAIHKGLNPDLNLEDIHPEKGDIYAFFFPPGTH